MNKKAQELAMHEKDTGSSEVQIALLTEKIETLSTHIKQFKKDKHSSVGLLRAVNRRKKLLEYLKKTKMDSYKNVLSKLGFKKIKIKIDRMNGTKRTKRNGNEMFKVYKKEIEVAGKKISLETGKVARQADGAIIASCGETVILATVVGAKKVNPDMDYFPLSVNYQEKYYAGGKIPGGYFKREARPTESEQLISRLIDRPIRPLFPGEFKNEVQLLPTVISYDKENQPDILAITASSAALAISGMPFMGPVGASRVGYVDGKYILNPSKAELENSSLDLVVAGTKDAVLMVESETKGLTEEVMLDAVKFGHEGFVPVIEMIEELAKECRKPEWTVEKKDLSEVKKKLEETFTADLTKAFGTIDKQDRSNQISEISEKAKQLFADNENYSDFNVNDELKNLEKKLLELIFLKTKKELMAEVYLM